MSEFVAKRYGFGILLDWELFCVELQVLALFERIPYADLPLLLMDKICVKITACLRAVFYVVSGAGAVWADPWRGPPPPADGQDQQPTCGHDSYQDGRTPSLHQVSLFTDGGGGRFVLISVPDPWHFGVDPDPSVFIIDLQDANKKLIFFKTFFCIVLFEGTFTSFSKIKSQKEVSLL